MAYYVEPDYWLEGYAEGDAKIVAALAASQSAMLIATDGLLINTAAKIDSQSALKIGPYRIQSTGWSAAAASEFDVGAYAERAAGIRYVALSVTSAAGGVVLRSGFSIPSNGIMKAAFRLKWENEQEPSDGWTNSSEPSDIWTDVTEPTDGWS